MLLLLCTMEPKDLILSDSIVMQLSPDKSCLSGDFLLGAVIGQIVFPCLSLLANSGCNFALRF